MNLIRGEYFPVISDKILFHYDNLYTDPNTVEDGDTIYCDTHRIQACKDILSQRRNLTIITHNSDGSVRDGEPGGWDSVDIQDYGDCFDRWYAQNLYSTDERTVPLPIGFENRRWERQRTIPRTSHQKRVLKEKITPESLVYLNCNVDTNMDERSAAVAYFTGKAYATVDKSNLRYDEYLRKIRSHKFTISPKGHGLDCHRTWEVLIMQRVPVLKREGRLEDLYEDLPVLFVNDWSELNQMDLDEVFASYSFDNQEYLYFDYWDFTGG